jgi:putative ABC transport system permease protein
MTGSGEPQRLEGAAISWDLLEVLGVTPALGRPFTRHDDRGGAPGTVLLSDGLWRTAFGGDPAAIGRTVILDDEPREIVGVMPRTFTFPLRTTEFWTPIRFGPTAFDDRADTYIKPIARLKPDVTLDRARAELRVVASRLEREYPEANARITAFAQPLGDQVSDRSRLMLFGLLGASACVLLIACTNLANLLLARAVTREREIAIRLAIGAGADRLVRQMLTEALVLAGAGGLAGAGLALLVSPFVAQLVPTTLPIAEVPAIDGRVLTFAAAVTLLTGLAFGMAPALGIRGALDAALRSGPRAGAGPLAARLRSTFVVAEVAACVVLLICAGLLLNALWRVQSIDPGFRTEGVLTLRTTLPLPKYASTARRSAFYQQVLSEVRALPGVAHAAYISFLPMVMRGGIWEVVPEGRVPDPADRHVASLRYVTPGFFDTMRIPLTRGRDISDADTTDAEPVAVVSESFVREHWPGQDPIGRRFQFALQTRTVVGVAGDVRVRGLERTSEPQVYLSYQQVPDGSIISYTPKDLVIRTAGGYAALAPAARQIVARADPLQPISHVRPLSEIVEAETGPRRTQVQALAALALTAFVLAALGIHGLLAFTVSARTREIGVRLALGAQRPAIVQMIASQAVRLALAGVTIAMPVAYIAGRRMESLLAGVSPAHPGTAAAAVGLALIMTVAGSVIPAMRAARVNPVDAMRME